MYRQYNGVLTGNGLYKEPIRLHLDDHQIIRPRGRFDWAGPHQFALYQEYDLALTGDALGRFFKVRIIRADASVPQLVEFEEV
jgi:hypothetical protein